MADIPEDNGHGMADAATAMPVERTPITGDTELARCFALCFGGSAGKRVLAHLRAITIERTLGPAASDGLLRYVEGQRQIVSYAAALAERGRSGPPAHTPVREADFEEDSINA